MEDKISCGYFEYLGDAATLDSRWESCYENLNLFLEATGEVTVKKTKASYLLFMGHEAFEIYRSKKKATNDDTLIEIQAFMSKHFVAKNIHQTSDISSNISRSPGMILF